MNSTGTCSARKGAKGRWTPEVEQDMVSSKVNTNCITCAVRARPSARPEPPHLDSQAQTTTHCLCAPFANSPSAVVPHVSIRECPPKPSISP